MMEAEMPNDAAAASVRSKQDCVCVMATIRLKEVTSRV